MMRYFSLASKHIEFFKHGLHWEVKKKTKFQDNTHSIPLRTVQQLQSRGQMHKSQTIHSLHAARATLSRNRSSLPIYLCVAMYFPL